VLQDLVYNYNHTYHTAINMSPADVNEKNEDFAINNSNESNTKTTNDSYKPKLPKPKFKVGDLVRIARLRRTFQRETDDKFSEKIYKINEVRDTNPPTYRVEDLDGKKEYDDIFYEKELIKYTADVNEKEYKIEKYLDIKKVGRNKHILVKWLGYDEPTWEPWNNLKDVQDFDKDIKELQMELEKKKKY
jgi:hypothetical protein